MKIINKNKAKAIFILSLNQFIIHFKKHHRLKKKYKNNFLKTLIFTVVIVKVKSLKNFISVNKAHVKVFKYVMNVLISEFIFIQ